MNSLVRPVTYRLPVVVEVAEVAGAEPAVVERARSPPASAPTYPAVSAGLRNSISPRLAAAAGDAVVVDDDEVDAAHRPADRRRSCRVGSASRLIVTEPASLHP